jgi:hypothetical protein
MKINKLELVLLIPIIVGSERYGTLVINRPHILHDFTKNEIKTALKAAILIGLALNNETKQKNIQEILESLNKFDLGIFIIQNNPEGKPKLKYFNTKFKTIFGFDERKLSASDTFEEYVSLEDIYYVEKLYIARQKGDSIPNLYRVNIKTASGIKQIELGITVALYEKKIASYCFLIEIPKEKLKTPKEIFNALEM